MPTADSESDRTLLSYWVPYVFNRVALGAGALLGFYHLYNGRLYPAALIFFVFFPTYFYLHRKFDAP